MFPIVRYESCKWPKHSRTEKLWLGRGGEGRECCTEVVTSVFAVGGISISSLSVVVAGMILQVYVGEIQRIFHYEREKEREIGKVLVN